MYGIVLVEDHAISREGLCSLFFAVEDFEVVGEAGNGREALGLIRKVKPDLVITDLSMPEMDGIELIKTAKEQYPKIKVVALTVHSDNTKVLAALKAGADGYILKEAPFTKLVLALRCIMKGKRYVSPEIPRDVVKETCVSCI